MRFDSTSTSTSTLVRSLVRGKRGYIAAAIVGAAMLGAGASPTEAAATYNYVFNGTTGTTVDWATAAAWVANGTVNAVGYPGGDPTVTGDIASITFINTTAAVNASVIGANIITLSSPLASSLANLSLVDEAATNSDTLTLNLNADLSVTGGVAITGGSGTSNSTPVVSRGVATLNTAANTTFTVGGTVSVSSSTNGSGFGMANVTINGNASFGGLALKNEGSNFIVSSTAGNVSLGNVSLTRSANNGTAALMVCIF